MTTPPIRQTRRALLGRAAGAALAAAAPPALLRAAPAEAAVPRAIRLGGPIFEKTSDPEAMALAHRKLGYRAAYCPGIGINDTDRIKAVEAAFAKHDVVLAEVGVWCNLLDPDDAKRAANLKRVTEGLALAEAVGARCCVDIAGSYNPKSWFGPHPDNLSPRFFDATVENARTIVDAVKPKRAKFALEMMGWAMPDSPECNLKLIKAVDREGFGVHLDPCNLINCPERFYRNSDLLNACFDTLGPWIASCHAKDLTWDIEMNVHFREVVPGTGTLDYTTFLNRLAALPQGPPLMMEHLGKPEEYERARDYIVGVGKKAGLAFE
jgi:sugar phosphate isomerase/epimerase